MHFCKPYWRSNDAHMSFFSNLLSFFVSRSGLWIRKHPFLYLLSILIPIPKHEYLEQGNIRVTGVTLSYVGCVNSLNDTFTYVYVIHFDGDILTPFFGVTPRIFSRCLKGTREKSLEMRQDTCHLSELWEKYGLMFDTFSIPKPNLLYVFCIVSNCSIRTSPMV